MENDTSREVTEILARIGGGDDLAAETLLPLLYSKLHSLAQEFFRHQSQGQTLQPTALVHEAFLKLNRRPDATWKSRAHFLAVAAKAMRQILANHAARRRTAKRGGDMHRVTLTGLATPTGAESEIDLIDLDDALGKLGALSPRQARIVELRFLAGLEESEIAHVLEVSTRTVEREWRMARAFLQCELKGYGLR